MVTPPLPGWELTARFAPTSLPEASLLHHRENPLDVFRRLSELSQADNSEPLQKLKDQRLVWETSKGQKVQVLTRRGSFREVQVQEAGTGKSYWTYLEALER
jgi:hypothetical protein